MGNAIWRGQCCLHARPKKSHWAAESCWLEKPGQCHKYMPYATYTLSTLEEINLLSGTSCTFNFLLQNSQTISTHPTSSWLCSSQLIFPINDISMYLSLCFLSLQDSTLPFLWQRFWCKSPSKSEHRARKQIQPLTETREEKNSHSPWFRVMRATFSVILIYLQQKILSLLLP